MKLGRKVYPVPASIDGEIARLRLKGMGIQTGKLTREQEKYPASRRTATFPPMASDARQDLANQTF